MTMHLLLGIGESSDAYHMSAPHPEGLGARAAMHPALARPASAAREIDYINLHGTGTPSNDSAEEPGVAAVFGDATPCSSTKGATGHTLGAAGALEAVICALALQHGLLPGGPNTEQSTRPLRSTICGQPARRPIDARAQQFLWLWRHQLRPRFGRGQQYAAALYRRHRLLGRVSRIGRGAPADCRRGATRRAATTCRRAAGAAARRAPPRRRQSSSSRSPSGSERSRRGAGSGRAADGILALRAAMAYTVTRSVRRSASADRSSHPTRFHNSVHNAPPATGASPPVPPPPRLCSAPTMAASPPGCSRRSRR